MKSFAPWLKPTLLGPLMTMWILTTLGSMTIGSMTLGDVVLSGDRLDAWAVGMLWSTFFGSTLGVMGVAVDVLLLRMTWRRLPTGARAWLPSILAPFGVFFIWTLPFLPPPETAVGLVAFITAPMVVATFALRMLFGTRP
ncbi:MAG TPA: hypothetical protein RMH99_12345 [Sandaracinaceae bacterium LLY-WYZ-13_1]|nr:hypothetical protein [Sandaracinaceae bacterium LLY-WYZ-13_1]